LASLECAVITTYISGFGDFVFDFQI